MKVMRKRLIEWQARKRPPGYADEILASAKEVRGELVIMEDAVYYALVKKYARAPQRGLGDTVASVLKPIARGIDAVAGTKLANCGGCAKRQETLNRIVPRI